MSNQTTQFRSEIKLLLQAGLLIFTFTVGVGILNGLDVIDFSRPMLMAHVHAGTLGWITLGFIAACLWIFSEGQAPPDGGPRPRAGWESPPPSLWRSTLMLFTPATWTCGWPVAA
jgi:hypothetical protein